MRFISSSSKYTFDALKPYYGAVTGPHGPEMKLLDKGVLCQFSHGGLLAWEWDVALERFGLRGLAQGEDPRHRFSVYDTELEQRINGWTDDTRKDVEKRLIDTSGADHILVEKPKLEAPWPTYDKLKNAIDIAKVVRENGYEPHYVCNYERENLNRSDVIDAVSAIEYEVGEEIFA